MNTRDYAEEFVEIARETGHVARVLDTKTCRVWFGEFDPSEFPEGSTWTREGTDVVVTVPGE